MFKRMAELWIELTCVVKAVTGRGRHTQGVGVAVVQTASKSAAEVSSNCVLDAPAVTQSHVRNKHAHAFV